MDKTMIRDAYKTMLREREWLPSALLLALGFALRLAYLGAVPFGLNQDEASAGYEAFALLHSGIDRCGDSWPVLFTAWGSGQNVLMSYLSMPFVALLGLSELSVRLVNAVSGCLTLLVFWRLARRARGRAFGITALALLAVNPWHIMMSRWALESNLLPLFLLLGVWLTAIAREKPWALAGAAASLALSLYAYGAAFFFLPLYLIAAVVWLRRYLRPGPLLLSLALGLLLAAPIAACQLINALGLPPLRVLGLTLPRLTEGRQAAVSVLGGADAGENFRGFLRILWTQSDGLPWNSLGVWRGGIFYFFGLPFAALGFFASLFRRRDYETEGPLRIAFVCALVCAALICCNINRINMIWLPLIYFSALGFHLVCARLGNWAAGPAAAAAVCLLLFVHAYRGALGGGGNPAFFPGLGAAVEYAQALEHDGPVYITDRVNQPYIFALFYTRTPPEVFAATVEYRDETAAFRAVKRFAGFEFEDRTRASVRILWKGEAEEEMILKRFGDFAVCAG